MTVFGRYTNTSDSYLDYLFDLDYDAPMKQQHKSWLAAACILIVVGWVAGTLVLASDDDRTMVDAITHLGARKSAFTALVAGLICLPLLRKLNPWPWALAVAPLMATIALLMYFFLWPHSWQASRFDAYKPAWLFTEVYWRFILPSAILAAAATGTVLRVTDDG